MRQVAISHLTGFPPSIQITLQEYDLRGNVLAFRAEADFNGDGTIDARQSGTNTYNSQGQLVRTTFEADFNGDNTIDYISVVTVVYDGVKH